MVKWDVDFHDDFVPEYRELPEEVQDELLAAVRLLEQFGPRDDPHVDTLNDSRHHNMKLDSMLRTASGASPSTRNVAGSYSAAAKNAFTARLSTRPTSALTPIGRASRNKRRSRKG